jgi:Uma2 family endonuclease
VIIEVVSPSTEAYDRGAKFDDDYQHIPSLREYVLVAQAEATIEVRSRDDAGQWIVRRFTAGQRAEVRAASCTLDVDAIYREANKNAASTPTR